MSEKKKYCIFEVYDYKGGELSSNVNMTEKEFINTLAEHFENCDFEDIKNIEKVKETITAELGNEDFYSEYAGGEGFVGEMYEIVNNKMEETSFEDNIDKIANHIVDNWEE